MDKLLYKTIKYLKITEAGIRSDMAARIMHSTLPAVVNKSQIVSTQGAIDHSALLEAIKGSKNIIKYGLKACIGELNNMQLHLDPQYDNTTKSDLRDDVRYNGTNLEKADLLIKYFSNDKIWKTNYGGQKWLTIAKSLKRIIYLDNLVSTRR